MVLLYLGITIELYFNYYVPWWFPFLNTLLVIGLGYPVMHFIVSYWYDDNIESRGRLTTAFVLMILLTFLLYVWTLTFFEECFTNGHPINFGYGAPTVDADTGEETDQDGMVYM